MYTAIRSAGIRFHRLLAWFAGIALLIWGVSGLVHPLMVFTGPEIATFYPPSEPLDLSDTQPIGRILEEAKIETASAIKVIAGPNGHLLQVTEKQDTPRRYFRLGDGRELENYDPVQAEFLARHYTGLSDTPLAKVTFQTEFDQNYPWVNRLLPVYKVDFDTPDNLSIYIYTETGASAFLTNNWKRQLQNMFQVLHTWNWMPHGIEAVRVGIVALLIGSLVGMSISGLIMLITIRRSTPAPGFRRWHRVVAYGVGAPVLLVTASGFYHLVFHAGTTPARTLTLSPPIDVAAPRFSLAENWASVTAGLSVSSVSLVQKSDGQQLYRLGLNRPHGQNVPAERNAIRNARFDGLPRTGPALYLTADDGEPWAPGDKEFALQLSERLTGRARSDVAHVSLITRFGTDYDFRNKRLPVWKVRYGVAPADAYFIDTNGGVLADKRTSAGRWEQLSFSMLHKWNFLRMIGRDAPNIALSIIIGFAVSFLGFGGVWLQMRRARRGR